ncbi:hypothetical protein RJ639_034004 [Escallonia herrerae]|uniref:ABC transporter domain-containing protein n=1 Tax=Escallonia herrerae TaxID=1293975 RepID=A0AA88WSZ9_9ASTE|nr:hypothetical protein RJ639_034004 [Escallonia herrerae]
MVSKGIKRLMKGSEFAAKAVIPTSVSSQQPRSGRQIKSRHRSERRTRASSLMLTDRRSHRKKNPQNGAALEINLLPSPAALLPADMPKPEKVLVVERVIESLGLQPVRKSLVGTIKKRGISEGQRKRVNVGLEMVIEPSLLILDEPTSGLDSSSSQLLLRTFRREALEGNILKCYNLINIRQHDQLSSERRSRRNPNEGDLAGIHGEIAEAVTDGRRRFAPEATRFCSDGLSKYTAAASAARRKRSFSSMHVAAGSRRRKGTSVLDSRRRKGMSLLAELVRMLKFKP